MLSALAQLARRLWNDDRGAVLTSEYLLLGGVVVLGGISGLEALRKADVAAMTDMGNTIRSIQQMYQLPTATNQGVANNAQPTFAQPVFPGTAPRAAEGTQPVAPGLVSFNALAVP